MSRVRSFLFDHLLTRRSFTLADGQGAPYGGQGGCESYPSMHRAENNRG